MNILMALSQLEVTGAEVYAATLGNALTARGHQVVYVSDTFSCQVQGPIERLQFNRRSLPRRVWHVIWLLYLFRKHRIQLVHAHSRASGWSCRVACWLSRTPMVTTVHGRQPVHASRKFFHAFGARAIAVCEDIQDQIVSILGVPSAQVTVIRNGLDTNHFSPRTDQSTLTAADKRPLISIIGRLSGPKGDLCFRLLNEVLDLDRFNVQVISGTPVPPRFSCFANHVHFTGFQSDIRQEIQCSSLVIGAGRVAAEALLCGVPVFAIGEAKSIGPVTFDNIHEALRSNFGDIGPKALDIDFHHVKAAFDQLAGRPQPWAQPSAELLQAVRTAFDLGQVTDRIEALYQDVMIEYLGKEMPVLMYHRFIESPNEQGIHGTWITARMFEKHLKLMKALGYETLTFRDLASRGLIHRLQYGKKYLMITADDGYQDNLMRMLPLLQKYGFQATVFVVSNETFNRWDVENTPTPDVRVPLMTASEIRQLDASGAVEIGGHTLSHQRLDQLPPQAQWHEIAQNKIDLEAILGHPINVFAYPFGNLNESAKEQAQKAGYQFAVATDSGPLAAHQDLFQIRRIGIFPRTGVLGLYRKIKGDYVFKRAARA